MTKAAILILAGTESHSDTGRLVNGLEAATEFAENLDDDLELIFDGRKSHSDFRASQNA